jgi:hypothetical protein
MNDGIEGCIGQGVMVAFNTLDLSGPLRVPGTLQVLWDDPVERRDLPTMPK